MLVIKFDTNDEKFADRIHWALKESPAYRNNEITLSRSSYLMDGTYMPMLIIGEDKKRNIGITVSIDSFDEIN